MKKLLIILCPLVILIAVLLPQSESPPVPNSQAVHGLASNPAGMSIASPNANSEKRSPREKSASLGAANDKSLKKKPLAVGSNTQQVSVRFIPPVPGESGRKVAAMKEAEELELLQIQMAYDRSSTRRDPKITERWFEWRKQSRLLKTGMARQEAIQLLGTPSREGVNPKGFFLDYSPNPGVARKMYDSYENLVLNFNPNGQLRDWDWYTPDVD